MKALLLAGSLGLIGTLIGTRWAISILIKKGYGQLIRDDGPTSHHTKRGTPTMGGLVIIVAVLFAYFGAKLILREARRSSALLLLFFFVGLGAVGFVDDYIKISKQRSLGLRSKAKFGGQIIIAVIFAWLVAALPRRPRQHARVTGDLVHPASSAGSSRPFWSSCGCWS